MIRLCIPTIKRFDLLEKEIASTNAGSIIPEKITVLDNSSGSCPKFENMPNVEVLVMEKNLGVAGSWNYFMKNFPDDINIIANDDLEFGSDFVDTIVNGFLGYANSEDVGMVYPWDGDNPINAFSCFILKTSTFQEVGEFDETFFPAYFEDNDYHHRMIKINRHMHAIPNCNYKHVGSATLKSLTGQDRQNHHRTFEKNKRYYIQKWGGPPGHETK